MNEKSSLLKLSLKTYGSFSGNANELELEKCSGYKFAFPALNASAKTTTRGLIAIHCHGIPHNIASDQEAHFSETEMQQWAHAHGIHWSYHITHNPKVVGLTEE